MHPIAAATFLSITLLPLLPPPYRWWSLTSPWDAEIASVALPALCAMLMEPVVGAINSGAFSAALCQQDLVRPWHRQQQDNFAVQAWYLKF